MEDAQVSPVISAGDVEKYAYCPLSWWLSIGLEEEPDQKEALVDGEAKHGDFGKDLSSIVSGESAAKMGETVVLWFAITATLISIVGLSLILEADQQIGMIMGVIALIWILAACYFLYLAETITSKKSKLVYQRIILIFAIVGAVIGVNSVTVLSDFFRPEVAQIMQVLSLVWLIAASFFLYRSLKHFHAARLKRQARKVKDAISYVDDTANKPKLFVSKKYGLSGRPDYVILVGEAHIPVEIKTGRTPRGPLFSHIMQVAAYCLLMEEEYARPPPHGVIRYPETEHEIDYDESLKKLVISKLDEIREKLKTEDVHRNHNKPGKCRSCSRKSVCQERMA